MKYVAENYGFSLFLENEKSVLVPSVKTLKTLINIETLKGHIGHECAIHFDRRDIRLFRKSQSYQKVRLYHIFVMKFFLNFLREFNFVFFYSL